jgi:hypothetical protein
VAERTCFENCFSRSTLATLPVVEQALETTALMLGTDKSRGYCLEMICADFLAGAATQENQSEVLALFLERLYKALPDEAAGSAMQQDKKKAYGKIAPKATAIRPELRRIRPTRKRVLNRDGWKCQSCGTSANLQVHHLVRRSHLGPDALENLMTLCAGCHRARAQAIWPCLSR